VRLAIERRAGVTIPPALQPVPPAAYKDCCAAKTRADLRYRMMPRRQRCAESKSMLDGRTKIVSGSLTKNAVRRQSPDAREKPSREHSLSWIQPSRETARANVGCPIFAARDIGVYGEPRRRTAGRWPSPRGAAMTVEEHLLDITTHQTFWPFLRRPASGGEFGPHQSGKKAGHVYTGRRPAVKAAEQSASRSTGRRPPLTQSSDSARAQQCNHWT